MYIFPPFSTFFCLFPAFFCPFLFFPIPFISLFCFIKSSPPSVILLYPFLPSFTLSSLLALIFCLIPLFIIPQSFISYSFILIRPFSVFISLYPFYLLPFIFALFTLIPVYVFPLWCSILLKCQSLCNLLLECLDALRHALRVPYHLLIYFPSLYGSH